MFTPRLLLSSSHAWLSWQFQQQMETEEPTPIPLPSLAPPTLLPAAGQTSQRSLAPAWTMSTALSLQLLIAQLLDFAPRYSPRYNISRHFLVTPKTFHFLLFSAKAVWLCWMCSMSKSWSCLYKVKIFQEDSSRPLFAKKTISALRCSKFNLNLSSYYSIYLFIHSFNI